MASRTVLDSGDSLRLRNEHPTEDLIVPLNKKAYRVAPGEVAIVPFELVRVYWGDPRSREGIYTKFSDSKETGYVNKREDEISRLGNLYGSFAGDVDELCDPEWPATDSRYGKIPKLTPWPISVQTLEGKSVLPPCFDKSGEQVYGAVMVETEDLNDAATYRRHLENRLDDIQGELRRVAGHDQETDDEVDLPVGR
jgi:hypothetical protein